MIYQVKYPGGFLRYGRIHPQLATIYYHPSSLRRSIIGFERRFPDQKGKGLVQCVEKRAVVKEYVPVF